VPPSAREALAKVGIALSVVASAAAVLIGTAATAADTDPGFAERALGAGREAVGRAISNHALTDANGRRFQLSEFRGRALVINMIYTSCFDFCPTLTTALAPKVAVARAALGPGKFAVLTVGFDVRNDTPARMRAYAHRLGIDDPDWLFASADEATIAALANEIGFTFARSAGGFDHPAQTTLIDPAGRVYRQIYGTNYKTPLLVEPLKGLALGVQDRSGALSQLLEQVRILCTVYNPRTDRYHLDYSLFAGIATTVLIIALVIFVLAREWRRSRRALAARRP
jgi:protein SCO1/2